jgi:hypothetical protein
MLRLADVLIDASSRSAYFHAPASRSGARMSELRIADENPAMSAPSKYRPRNPPVGWSPGRT